MAVFLPTLLEMTKILALHQLKWGGIIKKSIKNKNPFQQDLDLIIQVRFKFENGFSDFIEFSNQRSTLVC